MLQLLQAAKTSRDALLPPGALLLQAACWPLAQKSNHVGGVLTSLPTAVQAKQTRPVFLKSAVVILYIMSACHRQHS